MLKKMLVAVAISAVAVTAFADDYARRESKQVIELTDGGTVYVFNDGKMAMTNKVGRVTRMDPGTVMEGKDGQKVTMVGDEVARLSSLLWQDYRSSR
jgi:hypothetical protein